MVRGSLCRASSCERHQTRLSQSRAALEVGVEPERGSPDPIADPQTSAVARRGTSPLGSESLSTTPRDS